MASYRTTFIIGIKQHNGTINIYFKGKKIVYTDSKFYFKISIYFDQKCFKSKSSLFNIKTKSSQTHRIDA